MRSQLFSLVTFMIVGATLLISETNAAATLRSDQGEENLIQKSSKKNEDDDLIKGISISKTFEYSGKGNIDVGNIMEQALAGEIGSEKEEKPKKKRNRNKKYSGKKRS